MGDTFSTVSVVRGTGHALSVEGQHGLPAVPPLVPPGQLVEPPGPGGAGGGLGTTRPEDPRLVSVAVPMFRTLKAWAKNPVA
ncbi:hypothetical protein MEA186_30232 [Mesorhizobium amorphae CCNWGS0123]|uniref:Uncharacterized protein n=1 Tax=Mesorhizobium amorphae CCNWGS0123 TaxID=1082933 RepID=G6YJ69_9HYPH|nr:hypothetical protein MEA186_30232 [Mesorhizobium amorphae CCNWGS0123]